MKKVCKIPKSKKENDFEKAKILDLSEAQSRRVWSSEKIKGSQHLKHI
jgi:hypothetical protein